MESKFDASTIESPQLRHIEVSQVKIQAIPKHIRNLIDSTTSSLAYLVGGSKDSIRIIDTKTGKKGLFREHGASISDVRFSPCNRQVLCSCDSSSKVFIWKVDDDLTTSVIESLNHSAKFVKGHPIFPAAWLLVSTHELTLVYGESGLSLLQVNTSMNIIGANI